MKIKFEAFPMKSMDAVCHAFLSDLKTQGLGPMAGRVMAAEYDPRLEERGKAAEKAILMAEPWLHDRGILTRHWYSGELGVEYESID